jgi:hypothetical protein
MMEPPGWRAAWDDAARALVDEALAAPAPPLEEAGWSGRGPYFSFAGETGWYGGDAGDTAESVRPFAIDVRRRSLIRTLGEQRRQPPEVVELAWYLLPYLSRQLREGWEAWAAGRRTGTREWVEARVRFNYA